MRENMPSRFYLWGAGNVGKRVLRYLAPLGILDGIIDADCLKIGGELHGLPVLSYDSAKPYLSDRGVIIAHFSPKETETILLKDGIAFWRLPDFVAQWYWFKRQKNTVGFLDFPITTRCTLNCKNCMQYMPYRAKGDVSIKQLKRDLAALFSSLDFVGEISIIGGEPFLHGHLRELIEFIIAKYRNQIGNLVITTNGMVIPEASVLESCREHEIFISISDYSDTIPGMDKRLAEFEAVSDGAGVTTERKRWAWHDPGRFDVDAGDYDCTVTHMQLHDGKLWRCTLMAAACAASLCSAIAEQDFFDLTQENGDIQGFLASDISASTLSNASARTSARTSQCAKCFYPRRISIPSAEQITSITEA